MRTVYLFLLALLSVLCWSCYDDQGNYDYHELNRTAVSGIDPVYRCDLLSRLSIPVVIQSEDKDRTYDYVWMYHKSEGSKKIDTISREKDLDWVVWAGPGVYRLIFEYSDKQTGVVNYIESEMIIESKYFRGWYVMKQNGETTDVDFFSPELQNTGLIQKSRGEALAGRPRSLGYIGDYAYLDEEKEAMVKDNACLMVVSEKELQVVRILDLKMVGDFNSLFYEKQSVVAPGKWFGGSDENGLVNDGKVFAIEVRGSPLGAGKFAYAKEGDYELAHLMTKNGTMSPLFFDTKSSKFCTVVRRNPNLVYLDSDDHSKFPEAYPDQEPLENEFTRAECFGMNRTFQMLYFSKGDKLYYYDLQNKQTQEVKRVGGQPAVPAGEKIVMIKHIIFDNNYEAPDEYTNKLVVATGNGSSYKLYLFDTSADKVKDNPEVYQGEGMPSEVMYMSSKMDNVYLCY